MDSTFGGKGTSENEIMINLFKCLYTVLTKEATRIYQQYWYKTFIHAGLITESTIKMLG